MKRILITGASSDIGRAMAVALTGPNDVVLLSGRNQAHLLRTKRAVERHGATARILVSDLSRKRGILQLIRAVTAATDSLDVFVHAAGIWHDERRAFADTPLQDFAQKTVLDTYMVGLIAPALLVHGLLPIMNRGGCLLAVSGTFENGAKGWLPYYGSKRGLEDLWVGLSQELADTGIRAYCISPSDTATDAYKKFFPEYVEESVAPEVVAEQAIRLCSGQAPTKDVVWVVKKDQDPAPGFHR